MAAEEGSIYSKAYPMNGGNDNYSYTKNSTGQGILSDNAKSIIEEEIARNLDTTIFSPSNIFRIADLGCSVGPNTFITVQNIVEAVKTKCQIRGLDSPKFHVFFNDHTSNDFNTLFKSLPTDRRYYAAGVPGSFHGRLFPDASLHLVYSCCSIQWLSNLPKQVVNKGRIYYTKAGDEVIRIYSNQHAKDMDIFLHARALEVVSGGLMVLIAPARQNGIPHSQDHTSIIIDRLGDCLMDMVDKGIIDEEKVDSMNLPVYMTSPQELEEAINRNGCFSIERMEINMPPVEVLRESIRVRAQLVSMHTRAASEGFFKEHFGSQIIDELFQLYADKVEEAYSNNHHDNSIHLTLILKRNPTT